MTTASRVDVPLDVLAAVSAEGLAYAGRDCRIALWNTVAAEITGIPAAKAVGYEMTQLFVDTHALEQLAPAQSAHVKLLARGSSARVLHATVLRLEGGWLLSFGQQRRYAEIEQLKNEIVAAVSHELKTPIATIKAFANTLRQRGDALVAERDQYLATIEQECDRLTEAVDDLLDAARVDGEHLLTRRIDVNIALIVEEAATRLRLGGAHPLERKNLDCTVSGDPDLLRSIFVHLLENAAKFSAHGSPIIVEAEPRSEATLVHVHDRGVGIDEEHLPYIFERFYRVEANMTSATPGSGLGLFVAKMLARAHGAEITVHSTPGAGSTFTLAFPVRR